VPTLQLLRVWPYCGQGRPHICSEGSQERVLHFVPYAVCAQAPVTAAGSVTAATGSAATAASRLSAASVGSAGTRAGSPAVSVASLAVSEASVEGPPFVLSDFTRIRVLGVGAFGKVRGERAGGRAGWAWKRRVLWDGGKLRWRLRQARGLGAREAFAVA
jgi:hypothetical protein